MTSTAPMMMIAQIAAAGTCPVEVGVGIVNVMGGGWVMVIVGGGTIVWVGVGVGSGGTATVNVPTADHSLGTGSRARTLQK